jgi:outer membrane protein OmpA-like peptidoglycan-associated protein
MKLSNRFYSFSLIISFVLSGCVTDDFGNKRGYNDTEKGAMMGAAGGMLLGALASKDAPAKGALFGLVGGGLAGGAVGHYMDSQKKDLDKALTEEKDSGAIFLSKQANDVILIRMTSQTAFDTNSATIKPGFHSTLDKIATVVNRYGKTHITIVGHTDNVGNDKFNQSLSEKRADAVEKFLSQKSVVPQRLVAKGMGERSPVADNASEQGRQLNRRVDLIIEPLVDESK